MWEQKEVSFKKKGFKHIFTLTKHQDNDVDEMDGTSEKELIEVLKKYPKAMLCCYFSYGSKKDITEFALTNMEICV